MEERFASANIVLCICTPPYRQRFEGRQPSGVGLGVAWEAGLIRQAIYDAGGRVNKFIPVLFESETRDAVPLIMRRYHSYYWPRERAELLALLRGPLSVPMPPPDESVAQSEARESDFPNNLQIPANRFFSDATGHLTLLRESILGCQPRAHAFALVGLGGVGKTQLAAQFAHVESARFSAVLWTRAGSVDEWCSSLAGLAGPSALALPGSENRTQAQASATVREWLRTHDEWLLIVDGADAGELQQQVGKFLAGCGIGTVLVTSRLARGWETMMPQMEVATWSIVESVTFIRQRGQAGDDTSSAEQLAQMLGGLPLALEQAMAFVTETGVTLHRYVELFADARSRLLSIHSPGATSYPESVAGTWLISVERVTAIAHALLRLSAFLAAAPLPRRAVIRGAPALELSMTLLARESAQQFGDEEPVVDEVNIQSAIGELARYSLAQVGEDTLTFHPLLRAVEEDRTPYTTRDEWEGVALAWANVNTPIDPGEPTTWPAFWGMELHILRVIRGKLVLPMAPAMTVRLMLTLGIFYRTQASYEMASALLNLALDSASEFLPPHHQARAHALHALGWIYHELGLNAEAERIMRLTLHFAETRFGHDSEAVGAALNNLGYMLIGDERSVEAEPLLREAARIARQHFPRGNRGVAAALGNLSRALVDLERLDEAESMAEEAVNVAARSDGQDEPERARQLVHLSRIRSKRGRHEEAEELAKEAVRICETTLRSGHPEHGEALASLGTAQLRQRHFVEAEATLSRAVAILRMGLPLGHPSIKVAERTWDLLKNRPGRTSTDG